MMKILDIDPKFPIVTCDEVPDSKPHPGLFLAAAEKLGCPISQCVIVGDSVWDQLAARRASTIGVGVLTGGYTEDELCRAGAYRVYRDVAEVLRHLNELGIRLKP
jgi:phosphoglycolate phosphatase-like HAD superfamily hydrolase